MYIVVHSDAQETAKQGAILAGVIMSNEEPNIAAGCPNRCLKTGTKHRQIWTPNGSFPEKPGPILVENPLRLIPRQFRCHPLPPIKVGRATNDDWLCHLHQLLHAGIFWLPTDHIDNSTTRTKMRRRRFTPRECRIPFMHDLPALYWGKLTCSRFLIHS